MASRFTGGWAQKKHAAVVDVPLVADIDPQHSHPDPNIDVTVGNPLWVASGPAVPTLPTDYTGDPFDTPVAVGGGPINHTPDDPSFGVGGGHGQTVQQAQAVRTALMSDDLGAVAAHEWVPAVDRDGAPHVAIIWDTPGMGNSPQTNDLKITGVGGTDDPYARTGKRIKRWYDRHIDMHRYPVEYRPRRSRNAYTAQVQPPVPEGNQYDSPYSTPWGFQATPDSFVPPQDRQVPDLWLNYSTTEAVTDDAIAAAGIPALPSWGL